MKYIIVSGGVLSGLGKGITAASLGLLLESYGYKVTAAKCDMYLNIDAGTMNPIEHGEVFVTHDGLETDQDLGHYERFLDVNLNRVNYTTNGQIYFEILQKERALEYKGVCVEPYHHIPPEIIKRWDSAGKFHKADIVIIELGGTVGEYEGLLFFEAARRLKKAKPQDVCFVHVGYLPAPPSIGELKSKPIQQSISLLNSLGIQPDFIVGRSEKLIDMKRKQKIALSGNFSTDQIISNPDMESIYEVPLILEKQDFGKKVLKMLGLKQKSNDMKDWKAMVSAIKTDKKVKIGIVGKYQKTGDYILSDSYVCVVEALKHACWQLGTSPEIHWIDAESITSAKVAQETISGLDGIIVPQGWGSRGVEGKIKAIQYARENKIPYFGLCFGMQMAAIEFARNVLNLSDANSEEVNPMTKNPVIHLMDNQKENMEHKHFGGTIRLGAWPCKITKGTTLQKSYSKDGGAVTKSPWYKPNPDNTKTPKAVAGGLVYERHRHRYEFNNKYRQSYEKAGMRISGTSPDNQLVEAVEIGDHPFFVGVQFHPEYLSRPLRPHPLFLSFIKATEKN